MSGVALTHRPNARTAVTVDNPDEHAAYCALCETPMLFTGVLCYACANPATDEEEVMTIGERVEWCSMQLINGNRTDAVNGMMFDGDVRVDSVKVAINLVAQLVVEQQRNIVDVVGSLTRAIETWERT